MLTANSNHEPAPTQPARNTLGLSQAELARLAAELDAAGGGPASQRRKFARWPYRNPMVNCDFGAAGTDQRSLTLAARDLSATGISLLHSAYAHTQARCAVHLPNLNSGQTVVVPGVVVRCRHVRGSIHEVALRFDQPINARDFVRIDPFEGCFTLESVEPERLVGSILHIEDSLTDRAMLRQCLRGTGLTVTSADSAQAGLERAKEPYDLILCAHELVDLEGVKLVESIRAAEIQTPVIILSADPSPQFRARVKACKANGFLAKPPSDAAVLRAVAEFLLMGGTGSDNGGALYSTLDPASAHAELIPDYVAELRAIASVLTKALAADDAEAVRRACLKLMGSSRALGFDTVAQAAELAHKAVTASSSASESRKPIVALIGFCQRARVRAGAARKAA
jgi:CheY-like chemotaxis protein/HPt (histidine-containing phosphotransfer) domain-containing protein